MHTTDMPVVEHAGGIQRITGEKHTTDMPAVEHTGGISGITTGHAYGQRDERLVRV